MSLLSFRRGRLLHLVQVSLQSIDVLRPEAPEGTEPFVELHERLRSQSIEAPLCFDPRFHQARLSQHPQVLGDGWLRQSKLTLDLAHGALGREQQAEDGPSIGLRDDGERGFHDGYIAMYSYYCQGCLLYTSDAADERSSADLG